MTFFVSPQALSELAWPRLLGFLQEAAQTSLGKEAAIALPFLPSPREVSQSFVRIEESRFLLRQSEMIPLAAATDVREIVARAAKQSVLSGLELVACKNAMQVVSDVRGFLRARRSQAPHLSEFANELADLRAVGTKLEDCVEQSGAIKDEASSTLAAARRRAGQLHTRAREQLTTLMGDPQFSLYLQDNYFSVRNDRYVLPVNASYRSKVTGIVHNASQTGQTVFIEPQQLVDVGNELAIVEAHIREEEQRILAELSLLVADKSAELSQGLGCLARLDVIQASGRLAEALAAFAPRLNDAEAELALYGLRHPLLVLQGGGKAVVANDIRMLGSERVMVISGPNAGGKTVTLSAVALCALMLRAGLPIPASARSCLPLYTRVFSCIGDAQDLKNGLSTFSAHLSTLRDLLLSVDADSLVVIDEIAADTDPAEGAALAQSILERLSAKRARVLVTTHLDLVKALALSDASFCNARVSVDAESGEPNYRLELGGVGASNAFEMAERIGLPNDIIARAREVMADGDALSRAMTQLEEQSRKLDEKRAEFATQSSRLADLQAELEQQKNVFIKNKAEMEAVVKAELNEEIEEKRREIKRLMAELQKQPQMKDAQAVKESLERMQAELKTELVSPSPGMDADTLKVGSWVRVVPMRQEGRVIELQGDAAMVEMGTLRTRVKKADMQVLAERRPKTTSSKQKSAPGFVSASSVRCDVRGMRFEEALRIVEKFLDGHFGAGESRVSILHGFGSGALKAGIHDYLAKSPYVQTFNAASPEEGGEAVTVVVLKN